jgi:hypothetical protein
MGFSRMLIGWKRWGKSFGQSLSLGVEEVVCEQGEERKIRERVEWGEKDGEPRIALGEEKEVSMSSGSRRDEFMARGMFRTLKEVKDMFL